MARTGYDPATLTVTLTESIALNNKDYGSTQSFSVDSIASVTRRLITVTDTEATIASFGAAVGAGAYIYSKVQYIRFTNIDDTSYVSLTIKNVHNNEASYGLHEGKSFFIATDGTAGLAGMLDGSASAITTPDLSYITEIRAKCEGAAADLEMIIAETA